MLIIRPLLAVTTNVAVTEFATLCLKEQFVTENISATDASQGTAQDTRIVVDRSQDVYLPGWVKEFVHPELQKVGPSEYDLTQVELYLHPDQGKEGVDLTGLSVLKHLESTGLIRYCLGFHDASAMRAMDIDIFRRFFGRKLVFCWKATALDQSGHMHVPFFFDSGGMVDVDWYELTGLWRVYDPAACLKP
jgi:hypothetical protein